MACLANWAASRLRRRALGRCRATKPASRAARMAPTPPFAGAGTSGSLPARSPVNEIGTYPPVHSRLDCAGGPRAPSGSSLWDCSGAVRSRCDRIFAMSCGSSIFSPSARVALKALPQATPSEKAAWCQRISRHDLGFIPSLLGISFWIVEVAHSPSFYSEVAHTKSSLDSAAHIYTLRVQKVIPLTCFLMKIFIPTSGCIPNNDPYNQERLLQLSRTRRAGGQQTTPLRENAARNAPPHCHNCDFYLGLSSARELHEGSITPQFYEWPFGTRSAARDDMGRSGSGINGHRG